MRTNFRRRNQTECDGQPGMTFQVTQLPVSSREQQNELSDN